MKKLLIILAMALSFTGNAQVKKDSVNKPLPTLPAPADSVKILSKTDLEEFIKFLRDKTSVNYYESLRPQEAIQQLYFWFLNKYYAEEDKKIKIN